jgi:hypothetical protein
MNKISKISKMVALTAALGSSVAIQSVYAETVPTIEDVIETTQHSVTLDLKDPELKSAKSRIKILYAKEKSAKQKALTKKVTFNSYGEALVKVKGLKAGTTYEFKVEAKSTKSGASFSTWSEAKKVTTTK